MGYILDATFYLSLIAVFLFALYLSTIALPPVELENTSKVKKLIDKH
jgi:hypothetical protein